MLKNLGWRAGIGLFAILLAFIFLIPTFTSKMPEWWSKIMPKEKIHLGLDLQGGMHLVLEVQTDKALENHLDRVVEELKEDMRKSKMGYMELARYGAQEIRATLLQPDHAKGFQGMAEANLPDFVIKEMPKKDGHPCFSLTLKNEAAVHIRKDAVDRALETIRNRIDQFGVSEPDIRPQADDRILIQLPGVKDPERALKVIGKTALLEFKLVDEDHTVDKSHIPPGDEILYEDTINSRTRLPERVPYLLKKRSALTGEYITDARVQIDNRYNEPYVSLSFNKRGAKIFERVTGENVGKRLAIVLDNKIYSAPVIRDRISGGDAQITGSFSLDEARDLAIVLRAGALPAPVEIGEQRTVGPSLGKDSIDKGKKSGIIGIILVALFMVVYYGMSGLIANMALFLNIPFILACLAGFDATLTLPGIAGIILTLGMAVDANVLIFERLREEIRLGKTVRSAIETGYAKAMVTIFDANITTLIAALVLFQFGTGPIRGFAVTLSIGILSSMFTGVFLTRIVFDYFYVQKNVKKLNI